MASSRSAVMSGSQIRWLIALQLKTQLTSREALIFPALNSLYGIIFEKHKATVVLLTHETDVQKSTQVLLMDDIDVQKCTQRPTWP